MREQCVSSVLLVKHGQLFGLAIDRDLRNRVVAQGLNIDGPVASIATLAPLTLDACGHLHCPGDMMAMTDAWRQPCQRRAKSASRGRARPRAGRRRTTS